MYIKINKPAATIFMPRYIVTADAATLDTRLAIPSFREKCEESLYDYGMQPEIKWKTAIKTMKECPNDAVKTYLRRVSKNIVAMYMELKAGRLNEACFNFTNDFLSVEDFPLFVNF